MKTWKIVLSIFKVWRRFATILWRREIFLTDMFPAGMKPDGMHLHNTPVTMLRLSLMTVVQWSVCYWLIKRYKKQRRVYNSKYSWQRCGSGSRLNWIHPARYTGSGSGPKKNGSGSVIQEYQIWIWPFRKKAGSGYDKIVSGSGLKTIRYSIWGIYTLIWIISFLAVSFIWPWVYL